MLELLATQRGPAGGVLEGEFEEVLPPPEEPSLPRCSTSTDLRGWTVDGSRAACTLESELL